MFMVASAEAFSSPSITAVAVSFVKSISERGTRVSPRMMPTWNTLPVTSWSRVDGFSSVPFVHVDSSSITPPTAETASPT